MRVNTLVEKEHVGEVGVRYGTGFTEVSPGLAGIC